MKKKLNLILFLVIIIVLFAVIASPVCEVISDNESLNEIYEKYSGYNIYTMHYSESTGVSWHILDSNDESAIGEYVMLKYPYDIRSLKQNEDCHLDAEMNLIVISKSIKPTVFGGEETYIIKAEKVYITFNDINSNELENNKLGKDKLYIYDLSIWGIAKSVLGRFIPFFRLSF
ncbi:MAG: hypothetical protein LUG66_06865 [Clostridiales bacterium]|nr:hypothetical protein [Clostridiales bacterium]